MAALRSAYGALLLLAAVRASFVYLTARHIDFVHTDCTLIHSQSS